MKKRAAIIVIAVLVVCLVSGCIVKKESDTGVSSAKSDTNTSDISSESDTSNFAVSLNISESGAQAGTEEVLSQAGTEEVLSQEGTEESYAQTGTEETSLSSSSIEGDETDDADDADVAVEGGGKVVVYNWGEYIDPDVLTQFEEETGIQVVYEEFETNEIMYPKVAAGAVSYDLICPSDYMIAKMIDNELLQPINFDNIPNYANIDETYIEQSKGFDPENKYSIPYCWGTVGILYNTLMIDEGDTIDSWSVLWDEKYKGDILMQDSVRDAFMVAEKLLGYDINTTDEDDISDCADKLIEQRPLVQAYVIDQVRDKMIGEEAALGVIYSGEAIFTKRENENLEYVIPKEGTNVWIDSWVIPKNAQNVENAEKFLNFLCRGDIAEKNFEYITYSTPNKVARDLIDDDEIKNSTVAFPTSEMLENSQVYTYLGEEGDALYAKYWEKVKSS